MKRILIASTAALTLAAGAAQAEPATSVQLTKIESYAPNADLSGLTKVQAAMLITTIQGGDTESEKRSQVGEALDAM